MGSKLSVNDESAQPPVGAATCWPRNELRMQAVTSGACSESLPALAEHTLPFGSTRTLTVILPWSDELVRSARS